MPVITLEAHVTDIRRGLWCDSCSLPSRIEADVVFVYADTLRVIGRATEETCTNGCDA